MANEFYTTQMGHKFYLHDVPRIADALETIGRELAIANNKESDKERRYKELLNNVIDHMSAGESCHHLIGQLLSLGFSFDELVEDFNFSKKDVDDWLTKDTEDGE